MCWSLFLLKLKDFKSATLSKRDSNTDAFLRILQNFQKHLFRKTSAKSWFYCLRFSPCNAKQPVQDTRLKKHDDKDGQHSNK